jgi:hypothetical protein
VTEQIKHFATADLRRLRVVNKNLVLLDHHRLHRRELLLLEMDLLAVASPNQPVRNRQETEDPEHDEVPTNEEGPEARYGNYPKGPRADSLRNALVADALDPSDNPTSAPDETQWRGVRALAHYRSAWNELCTIRCNHFDPPLSMPDDD